MCAMQNEYFSAPNLSEFDDLQNVPEKTSSKEKVGEGAEETAIDQHFFQKDQKGR